MSKLNPQKATAYVGPGVLRKGGKITPVPNGPLVKKKGVFKGSTLKNGGPVSDTIYTKKDKIGNIRTNKYVVRLPDGSIEMGKVTKTKTPNGKTTTTKKSTKSSILGNQYTDDEIRKSMQSRKNGGPIRKAQNGDTLTVKKPTWQQMTQAQKSAKRAELISKGGMERFKQYKDSISADAKNRLETQFAEGAAKRGMTPAEYSAYIKKQAKGGDAPLEGLDIKGANKRGESKGSCRTGQKNKGECLKDNKRNGGSINNKKLGIMNKKKTGGAIKKAQEGVKIGNTTYNITNSTKDANKGNSKYPGIRTPRTSVTDSKMDKGIANVKKILKSKNGSMLKRNNSPIKKAQLGGLIRKAAKTVIKKTPKKITKFSSEAEKIAAGQKPNLQKAKESVKSLDDSKVLGSKKSYSKKGLEMAIERRTNPAAASKKMTKAQREKFDLERSYYKNGGPIKKAQTGRSIGAQVVEENKRQQRRLGRIRETNPERASKVEGRMVRRANRAMNARGAASRMKSGGMIKRADGSMSKRGLWDNIRAAAKKNKAAGKPGKKPTAAMLQQERKIKAKSKK